MEKLSVVVPCYNEEEVLPIFYEALKKECGRIKNIQWELLFVNDGSKDKTLDIIKTLRIKDDRIRYCSFSRNFGKEAAIYAGLKKTTGDYVVLMDADLQDPPELLSAMYCCLKEEGYDSVATRRTSRKGEPIIRSLFARIFYKLIRRISKTEIVDGARDYRMMKRPVVDAILELSEYNRFTKGIFGWVGFDTKWLAYVNVERAAGETKWSFWKLFKYSMEGIIGFSTAPLALASIFGLFFCFLSVILILFIIVRTLIWGDTTSGWPSLVCIISLIGGVQMLCIGILGQYLSKTYLETKRRPIFIVKEEN